jgi:vacuolar-type H+-ATPase subunit I/STV1
MSAADKARALLAQLEHEAVDAAYSQLKHALSAVLAELSEAQAEVAKLEALFQQTHGVHVSWVAVDSAHRARIAEIEAELVNAKRFHTDEYRNRVELEAEVARLRELADRVITVADECTGPHPVITAEDALTLIERELFERRVEIERLKQPAVVLAEAERLLRAVDIYAVRLWMEADGGGVQVDFWTIRHPARAASLAEVYAALTGGRDG